MKKNLIKTEEKMNNIRDILVVEDDLGISDMIREILCEQGYHVNIARNVKMALESLEKIKPHVIILDIWLEGNHLDGLGLLKKLRLMFSDIPVIMISGHANVELAASTIRYGAYDFIEKPFKTEKLLVVVKRALEARDLVEINSYLQHPNASSIFRVSNGTSKAAQKLRHEIRALANSNCRVMISGENGSQPSCAAKEIHEASQRCQKPFIVLSACWNGEFDNIQNIILGTDKDQSIFEKANGGTLVLENLHTIPLSLQSKILDALQKDCIVRANKVIKFDVRVMATFEIDANKSVMDFVHKKYLNEMLFHRLNVKSLHIPPLRSRVDDIIPLFMLAMRAHLDKYITLDISSLKHALTSYAWPCNTQELCNAAEYVLMMCKINHTENVTIDMLNANILGTLKTDFASFANISEYLDKDYKSAKKHFDIEYINAQLKRFSNNVAKTARFMRVDRAALYRKIRSLLGVTNTESKMISLMAGDVKGDKTDEDATIDA